MDPLQSFQGELCVEGLVAQAVVAYCCMSRVVENAHLFLVIPLNPLTSPPHSALPLLLLCILISRLANLFAPTTVKFISNKLASNALTLIKYTTHNLITARPRTARLHSAHTHNEKNVYATHFSITRCDDTTTLLTYLFVLG